MFPPRLVGNRRILTCGVWKIMHRENATSIQERMAGSMTVTHACLKYYSILRKGVRLRGFWDRGKGPFCLEWWLRRDALPILLRTFSSQLIYGIWGASGWVERGILLFRELLLLRREPLPLIAEVNHIPYYMFSILAMSNILPQSGYVAGCRIGKRRPSV